MDSTGHWFKNRSVRTRTHILFVGCTLVALVSFGVLILSIRHRAEDADRRSLFEAAHESRPAAFLRSLIEDLPSIGR